jgi:hypothetical protein
MVKGKEKITVRIKASHKRTAGRVFGARILKAKL